VVNRVGAPAIRAQNVGLCPTWQPATFFVKARFRTSKLAPHQPIAASTLHVIAPPLCLPRGGPQLPHVTPVPFTMPLGGPGFCFGLRQAVYEGSHECRHPLENVISVGKRAGR
jgi:hypothetical protein